LRGCLEKDPKRRVRDIREAWSALEVSLAEPVADARYVQAFPGPGARTVVPPRGGRLPRWSADGRELFYLEGNQVIAVNVTPGSTINTGSPHVIGTKSDADAPAGYDVARDGRFLMVRPVQSEDVFRQINVVINWFSELKRLVAQ
jgi:hypothetical protein